MKFSGICAFLGCLLISANAAVINQAELASEWNNFIQVHAKVYPSAVEEQYRRNVFADNLAFIKQHNEEFQQGIHTFTVGVNEYADLTDEEFRQRFTSNLNVSNPDRNAPEQYRDRNVAGLPAEVDYVQKGVVVGVKNQGSCSSCWAFTAVACVESHVAIKTGQLVSLSEQELVDCSRNYGNQGCNGGWMDASFQYIRQKGGLSSERAYPYKGYDSQCRRSAQVAAKISSYADITVGDEVAMQSAIGKHGPVAVGIDSSPQSFRFYRSGVFNDQSCNKYRPNHGVTVVGYGTSGGHAYWKVRNSWGTSWGQGGYIMMARNQNTCGIANHASFPIA